MKTDVAIRQIEKWSYDYIKMDCAGDKCYGVLAVRIYNSHQESVQEWLGSPHMLCPRPIPRPP